MDIAGRGRFERKKVIQDATVSKKTKTHFFFFLYKSTRICFRAPTEIVADCLYTI